MCVVGVYSVGRYSLCKNTRLLLLDIYIHMYAGTIIQIGIQLPSVYKTENETMQSPL